MLASEEINEQRVYEQLHYRRLLPVVDTNGSDSAMLDNTLEFLVMNGVDLPLAVMMCIPEPWEKNDTISQTEERLLSVLCNNDGTLGWTCINSFL